MQKQYFLLILLKVRRLVAIVLFLLLVFVFVFRIINLNRLLFLFYLGQMNELRLLRISWSFCNLFVFIVFLHVWLDWNFLLLRIHYLFDLFNLLYITLCTLSAYLLRKGYLAASISCPLIYYYRSCNSSSFLMKFYYYNSESILF